MPITRGTLISSSDPRALQRDRRLLSLKDALDNLRNRTSAPVERMK